MFTLLVRSTIPFSSFEGTPQDYRLVVFDTPKGVSKSLTNCDPAIAVTSCLGNYSTYREKCPWLQHCIWIPYLTTRDLCYLLKFSPFIHLFLAYKVQTVEHVSFCVWRPSFGMSDSSVWTTEHHAVCLASWRFRTLHRFLVERVE